MPGNLQAAYRPVAGSKLLGRRYGARTDVGLHNGQDISVKGSGNPVFSVFSGTVVYLATGSMQDENPGNGLWVQNKDQYLAIYLHVTPNEELSVGANVKAGQEIGKVDLSGFTDAPHLHFTIGRAMKVNDHFEIATADPMDFLIAGTIIILP